MPALHTHGTDSQEPRARLDELLCGDMAHVESESRQVRGAPDTLWLSTDIPQEPHLQSKDSISGLRDSF